MKSPTTNEIELDKRVLKIESIIGDKLPESKFMEILQGLEKNFNIIMDALDLMNDEIADSILTSVDNKTHYDKQYKFLVDRLDSIQKQMNDVIDIVEVIYKKTK